MIRKYNGRHAILGVILLACLVLAFGIVSSHIHQAQKRQQINDYQMMIEQQTNENNEKKDVVSSGNIQDYAADVARDQLGYGESDEKVYVNITGK